MIEEKIVIRELNPEDAAYCILDGIMNDPQKLEELDRAPRPIIGIGGSYIGQWALRELYNVLIDGDEEEFEKSFREKVSKRLGFRIIGMSDRDFPLDAMTIEYLGKLICDLKGEI